MNTRHLPDTSHEAFEKVPQEMRSEHYKKIISGLEKLKTATYEELASVLTLDKAQVGRRLCELERMDLVYKPGIKKATRSGRSAFCYQLRNGVEVSSDSRFEYKQGEIFG